MAVLLTGKPIQALLNVFLWVMGIVPGVVHALFVVNKHYADQRTRLLMRQSARQHQAIMRQMRKQAELQARQQQQALKREVAAAKLEARRRNLPPPDA